MLKGSAPETDQQRAGQLKATRCFDKTVDCTEVVDFLQSIIPRASAAEAA
jgi:hypothetical protein